MLQGAGVKVLAAVVVVLAALWIRRREAAGNRLVAAHLVLAILVLDASLFPDGGTSTGIFVLPVNERTTSVLFVIVPGLLLLRWSVRTGHRRFTPPGMAWLAFLAWMSAQAVAGHLSHNSAPALTQQVKGLVVLAAAGFLFAGTPAAELAGPRGIPRVVRWTAPVAVLLTVTSVSGVSLDRNLGLFTAVQTGRLGADAATVFACLGLLGLALALAGEGAARKGMFASGVLITIPLFSGQRAAVLGLAAGCAVFAVWAVMGQGRKLLRVRPTEKAAVALTLMAACAILAVAQASGHGIDPSRSTVATSFTSAGKADSAQSRINQWRVAAELIRERPVVGWGLGKEYNHVEQIEGVAPELVRNDLTHDILLDVLLRAGAIGLVLFILALGETIGAGMPSRHRRVPPLVATLGAAGTAVVVELFVRGLVESIFEKQRLVMLLGIALGIVASAARPSASTVPQREPDRDVRDTSHQAVGPTRRIKGHEPRTGHSRGAGGVDA